MLARCQLHTDRACLEKGHSQSLSFVIIVYILARQSNAVGSLGLGTINSLEDAYVNSRIATLLAKLCLI